MSCAASREIRGDDDDGAGFGRAAGDG